MFKLIHQTCFKKRFNCSCFYKEIIDIIVGKSESFQLSALQVEFDVCNYETNAEELQINKIIKDQKSCKFSTGQEKSRDRESEVKDAR